MNIRLGVRNRIGVGMTAVAALMVALLAFTSTRHASAAAASITRRTWFRICQALPSSRIRIWSTRGASA
jgi:hypothetical protein